MPERQNLIYLTLVEFIFQLKKKTKITPLPLHTCTRSREKYAVFTFIEELFLIKVRCRP